jgi:hypothetical protein
MNLGHSWCTVLHEGVFYCFNPGDAGPTEYKNILNNTYNRIAAKVYRDRFDPIWNKIKKGVTDDGYISNLKSILNYDVTNEYLQTGTVKAENFALYAVDVVMDMTLSAMCVGYLDKMSSMVAKTALNATMDFGVDAVQTKLYFSPQAQERISNNHTDVSQPEIRYSWREYPVVR